MCGTKSSGCRTRCSTAPKTRGRQTRAWLLRAQIERCLRASFASSSSSASSSASSARAARRQGTRQCVRASCTQLACIAEIGSGHGIPHTTLTWTYTPGPSKSTNRTQARALQRGAQQPAASLACALALRAFAPQDAAGEEAAAGMRGPAAATDISSGSSRCCHQDGPRSRRPTGLRRRRRQRRRRRAGGALPLVMLLQTLLPLLVVLSLWLVGGVEGAYRQSPSSGPNRWVGTRRMPPPATLASRGARPIDAAIRRSHLNLHSKTNPGTTTSSGSTRPRRGRRRSPRRTAARP